MTQPISNEDILRGKRALKARITQNAIAHLEKMDVRSATIFQRNGLLSFNLQEENVERTAAIVANPDHALRVKAVGGPLVFFKHDEQSKSQYALDVTGLFFSSSHALREAALLFFEKDFDEWLSARTIAVIREKKRDLLQSTDKKWELSAIQVFDAVKADYLSHLAALKQSIEHKYTDGINEYLQQVLRPSILSLDVVRLDPTTASKQHESIRTIIRTIVDKNLPLENACDLFFEKLGHLPITNEMAFGGLLEPYAKQNTVESLWASLWTWVNKTRSPLAKYHLSVFYFSNPDLIPRGKQDYLWREAAEILLVKDTASDGDERRESWEIRCDLAKHYIRFLDIRLPGIDSEIISVLALWLSERVAQVFGNSLETMARFHKGAILPELEQSTFLWKLMSPTTEESALANVIQDADSVWSYSMLSKIRENVKAIASSDVGKEILPKIGGAITRSTIKYPISDHRIPPNPTYEFEYGLNNTIESWLSVAEKNKETGFVTAIQEANKKIHEPNELLDAVKNIGKEDAGGQTIIAHMCSRGIREGTVSPDSLWEIITSNSWRQNFTTLDLIALESFCWVFVGVQKRNGQKWQHELPHLFARTTEVVAKDSERRRLLFSFTIISSFHSQTISAIERLLFGNSRGQFRDDVTFWRNTLIENSKEAPAWIIGRIRAVMTALHIA